MIQAVLLSLYWILPYDILEGVNWLFCLMSLPFLYFYIYWEGQLVSLFWQYAQWPSRTKLHYEIERASGLSGFAYAVPLETSAVPLKPTAIFLRQRYQAFLQQQRTEKLCISRKTLYPLVTLTAERKMRDRAGWLNMLACHALVTIMGGLSCLLWIQALQEAGHGDYWHNLGAEIGLIAPPPLIISSLWVRDPFTGESFNLHGALRTGMRILRAIRMGLIST